MTFFHIFIILVLALAAYYVLLIGKEMLRKAANENDSAKSYEEEEIDITEDLMHFNVTEIDPDEIPVDDTIIKTEGNLSESNNKSDKKKTEKVYELPFPMDVREFHKIVMSYKPDQPNPELEAIVFQVSNDTSQEK